MGNQFRRGLRLGLLILGASASLAGAPTLSWGQAQAGATPVPFDALDAGGFPVACYVDQTPEGVADVRQMAQCVYAWRVSVGSQPVAGAGGPIEYGPGVRVAHNVAVTDETKLFFGVMVALSFWMGMRAARS